MAARTQLLLALDAGTSAGRAAVFTPTGRYLAEASRPWTYESPAEAAPWGRAFDPSRFWALLCDAAREALARSGGGSVAAVAATGQRQATVFLDDAGQELYSGPNFDLRAGFEGMRLFREHGHRLHSLTGHLPPMMFAPARWLWFGEHHPEVVRRTARILMMADWITWRLCGRTITDPSNAAEMGVYDVGRCAWSDELLALVGLPRALLPELATPGTVAGAVSPAASAPLGVPAGTPVVVAGADTSCAVLGMGLCLPGEAGLVAGWSASIQALVGRAVFDPERCLWTTCSVIPAVWAVEGNCGMAGAAHDWLRDTVLGGVGYGEIDALAVTAEAGCGGTLAFLGPRVADYADPRLLWGGFLVPQANDLLPVGRPQLARAGLENIAFAIKANFERVRALSGPGRSSLVAGGGLTRSPVFMRILTDVLGEPVCLTSSASVSVLGAAMCAAAGINAWASLPEAAAAMAGPTTPWSPERPAQAEYLDAYARWLQAYEGLRALSGDLA